jgi:MFS transporter, Spinster family, sphingosine-1-phosphate transporter
VTEYRWRLVVILCFAAGLNYADRTALSAVFPLLKAEFGATDQQLGGVGAVFLWAYAAASPVAGALADRWSRSRMVVFSLAGWSLVTLATAFARSMDEILLTRVLLGLAEAAYLPAAIALIADYHASDTRATAIGLHTAGLTVGLIAGGTGAGYLGEHYGWRTGLLLLGGLGLVLAALAFVWLRDRSVPGVKAAPPIVESLQALLSRPSCLIIMAEAMTVSIGTWIFLNWLPLYFQETFQLSLAQAGFAGTFMLQGAGVVGLLVGGWFSDRVAGHQPRRRMLIQAVCLFVAAPFLLVFLAAPALLALNVCIVLFSFFNRAANNNETPLLCDLLPPRLRSTALGIFNAFNTFAGGIGVWVAGSLKATAGLAGVFAGISGIIVMAALLATVGYVFFLQKDLERKTA